MGEKGGVITADYKYMKQTAGMPTYLGTLVV